MGIAMTFARVPGPGDLRTLRKGCRSDDGIPGRERRATDDGCRRSRDGGELRRKSRIAVYRNVEMVFPFVLRQLGDKHMREKGMNQLIRTIILFAYFFTVVITLGLLWSWLWVPLLSIFELPDHSFYRLIFAVPVILLSRTFYIRVVSKFYRDEE